MSNCKYTKELLAKLVSTSNCWADVCRKVGIKPATGAQTNLAKRAKIFGIDHSHFIGQSWNKGRTFPQRQVPIKNYLVKGSTIKSDTLKKKLIKFGLKLNKCESCKRKTWNRQTIPLELDHTNGDHWDNRLENLKILCPNCHAQRHLNNHHALPL